VVEVQVSLPLALAAGLVSVLSACVLPLVPGYLAFVTALTLDARAAGSTARARRASIKHAALFMSGFVLVFLSLGLVATPLGPSIVRALPWLQRAGGILLAAWGAYLAWPLVRPGASGPSATALGLQGAGSLLVGLAFGAGWTPCIGPVLGSILLYVSQTETMAHGGLLLFAYAIGLSLPFLGLGVGLNWPLAGSRSVEAWIGPLRRVAGGVLALLGLALLTGYFARLTAYLAALGQLINLEL
jgi:cytochrome c-type biogenesis protein